MNTEPQDLIDDITKDLQRRAALLTLREQAMKPHLRGEDGRNEADFADRVSFNQNDEVLQALDEGGRRELGQIRAALERLRRGDYGTCTTCQAEIAIARLRAVPWATECMECASRH